MANSQQARGGAVPSPVLKAASVRLAHTDPYSLPVDTRLAQANQEGFVQGYEEGFSRGATEAGAALIEVGEALRQSVGAALAHEAGALRAQRRSDADRVVSLALEVARWVVRRELTSVPDAFFARLAHLLADRNRDLRTEIFTAPALVEPTRAWLDDPGVLVSGSPELAPGEARVNIGDTTIFAGFDEAFERARLLLAEMDDELDGATPEGDGADEDDGEDVEVEEVELIYDAARDGAW